MKPIGKITYAYLTKQFHLTGPYLKAIEAVGKRGDFTLGLELEMFEKEFARFCGMKEAIGVSSGTDALMLILKALGIGAGDEVITAPNSFIASASVIALTGATPRFVDVKDDYTLDPNKLTQAITKRTKAIIPVHLTGNICDLEPILTIANNHKIPVVEDCAQACGGKYDGKRVGSYGIAGAFSFHPMKILNVWGDGGAITTNDLKLAKQLRLWRNHGLVDRDTVAFFAPNSRLHTIQAAIALLELKKVEKIITKRQKLAELYDQLLRPLEPNVHVPQSADKSKNIQKTYTTYVIQVKKRDQLRDYLKSRGIESAVHYPTPIHLQKAAAYLKYEKGDFPVTENQAKTILTLPLHQYLKQSEIRYVVQCIKSFYLLEK